MDNEVSQTLLKITNEPDFLAKARLINLLIKEKGITHSVISRSTGIKPSYLSHILRLLRLPPLITDGYYSKQISLSHLFIISRVRNREKMIEVYEKILTDDLTVAKSDDLVREVIYGIKHEGEYILETEKTDFEKEIMTDKRISAKIIQTRTRSKLIIEVRGSLFETSRILRLLMQKIKDWLSSLQT